MEVLEVRHAEPRTEDANATWRRAAAGHAWLPHAVEAAFTARLAGEVEHRLLVVVCRPV
jgi:hypothetical protein